MKHLGLLMRALGSATGMRFQANEECEHQGQNDDDDEPSVCPAVGNVRHAELIDGGRVGRLLFQEFWGMPSVAVQCSLPDA